MDTRQIKEALNLSRHLDDLVDQRVRLNSIDDEVELSMRAVSGPYDLSFSIVATRDLRSLIGGALDREIEECRRRLRNLGIER